MQCKRPPLYAGKKIYWGKNENLYVPGTTNYLSNLNSRIQAPSPYSKSRFKASSAKLPKLITPLKGHSCSLPISPPTLSAPSVETTWRRSKHVNTRRVRPGLKTNKKQSHLDSNSFAFICDGVSSVGDYKRNAWCSLMSCLLQTYCYLNTNEKPPVSWQLNQCFEMDHNQHRQETTTTKVQENLEWEKVTGSLTSVLTIQQCFLTFRWNDVLDLTLC